MTRAAEFCYLAEMQNGLILMGLNPAPCWTRDPEEALRVTAAGRAIIQKAVPGIGFRKVLAG